MHALTAIILALLCALPPGAPAHPLAKAPPAEQEVIQSLLGSSRWPHRVIALLRLQRFDCPESATFLMTALGDPSSNVRSFALLTLAHRHVPQGALWLSDEENPKVIRTALRCGYTVDDERLARGVAALARASDMDRKLTAVELALLSHDEDLHDLAKELLKTIVLRMKNHEAGVLSPRLAAITGGEDARRDYKWRAWYKKHRRLNDLLPARLFESQPTFDAEHPDAPTPCVEADLSKIALLPLDEFQALAKHLDSLAALPLDLAVVIDCTASMSGELAQAQGGVDDLMRFTADVCDGVRVGVVGYRDRRAKDFEQIGWDLTESIKTAREHLWRLTALGGGDRPELVDKGLELAFGKMSWNPIHRSVVVLVGDAPPHPGRGTFCVDMARAGYKRAITTHVIGCDPSIVDSTPEEPVEPGGEAHPFDTEKGIPATSRPSKRTPRTRNAIEFFNEIAAAGGGRVVNLTRNERLVPEIAGLIVGETFEEPLVEFFTVYMRLCR
jgi:hypothetical protein